jgi:DNA-binding transcriptional ArsR family regulator
MDVSGAMVGRRPAPQLVDSDGDPVADGICAEFIREKVGIAPATASRHLTLLTDARPLIATRKKDGPSMSGQTSHRAARETAKAEL